MKNFIEGTPFALSGVAFGCLALGNLLDLRLIFGVLVSLFIILLLSKIILFFPNFKKELQNPINTSILGTFNLALMLFSVYLEPLIGEFSLYLWYFAIILHIILFIYFFIIFLAKLKVSEFHASYFIILIGLAVVSLTSSFYRAYALGKIFFWFSLIIYLIFIIPTFYRYLKFPQMPTLLKPLFCILIAPPNLCLTVYLQTIEPKLTGLIIFLTVLSLLFYILVLFRLPKLVFQKEFYPSYASFTFPFVISATATKELANYLANSNIPYLFWEYLSTFQTILATSLIIYTLIRYFQSMIQFLLNKRKGSLN